MVWRRLAACAVVAAVLVTPYLVNCWTRLGDPFVAVNRNTDFYRARAGEQVTERVRTDAYLASLVRERPVATADTVLQGLTTYPFMNKFRALHVWSPWLPRVLQALTLGGLLAWLWSPLGRWLLLLLVSSLVPYAFTWEIPGGAEWRFTMHAYPLFLIAAASFVSTGIATIGTLLKGGAPDARRFVTRAAVSLALAGTLSATVLCLPYARTREALIVDKRVAITPGWRDRVFFPRDWRGPVGAEGSTTRTSWSDTARVRLPLVPRRSYRVTATLAPARGSAGDPLYLFVYFNKRRVQWMELTADRFADYTFDLRASIVDSAFNTLAFRATRMPDGPHAAEATVSSAADDQGTLTLQALTIVMQE